MNANLLLNCNFYVSRLSTNIYLTNKIIITNLIQKILSKFLYPELLLTVITDATGKREKIKLNCN